MLMKSNECNWCAPLYLHDRRRKVGDRDGSRQIAARRFASPHVYTYHRSSAWRPGPSEMLSQFCRSNTPKLHLKIVEWRSSPLSNRKRQRSDPQTSPRRLQTQPWLRRSLHGHSFFKAQQPRRRISRTDEFRSFTHPSQYSPSLLQFLPPSCIWRTTSLMALLRKERRIYAQRSRL